MAVIIVYWYSSPNRGGHLNQSDTPSERSSPRATPTTFRLSSPLNQLVCHLVSSRRSISTTCSDSPLNSSLKLITIPFFSISSLKMPIFESNPHLPGLLEEGTSINLCLLLHYMASLGLLNPNMTPIRLGVAWFVLARSNSQKSFQNFSEFSELEPDQILGSGLRSITSLYPLRVAWTNLT